MRKHPWLFTKEGDLDLGPLLLALAFLIGSTAFVLEGLGIMRISVAAWSFFGALFSTVAIAGVPVARARILAGSKLPGEVAGAIATSVQEQRDKFFTTADGTD